MHRTWLLLCKFVNGLCLSLHPGKCVDLHYLDDFITAGPPQSLQCAQNLATAMQVCQRHGLSLHPGKCVGPSMVLVVLGIELDSFNQVARLLQEKLLALQNLISSWLPWT